MSLQKKTITGIKWTTFSSIITTVLQLIQLAILARFLEPSAFGLMALVMVVIGFSQALLDMGIGNAIIHKQQIDEDQFSTLYWVSLLAGFIVFIIVFVLAPFIAGFYQEAKLEELIKLVASVFIIQPIGQQFMIVWQKQMRFGEIAKIDIVNKLVSLVVSVYLAYKGYGVYALVYGSIAGILSQTVQFVYKGRKEHKITFVFQFEKVKEFLSFGAYQMGERTISYFNAQIDTLLVGKLLGAEALGIYTLAKQVTMRPAQVINPIILKVTFPAMAKIQNNTQKLKEVYIKIINYLSSVNFPIYAFLFLMAPQLVPLIFGEKWSSTIEIVQVLAVYWAIRSTANPIGALLLARGKVKWGFWWNFILFFYVPAGIYIASSGGILGISLGMVVIISSLVIPTWYFLVRNLCGAKFVEYHVQIIVPALITIVTASVCYIITLYVDTNIMKIVISGVVGCVLVLILNYFFNRDFIIQLQEFFKRKI